PTDARSPRARQGSVRLGNDERERARQQDDRGSDRGEHRSERAARGRRRRALERRLRRAPREAHGEARRAVRSPAPGGPMNGTIGAFVANTPPEHARAFYRDTLGLKLVSEDP